ncbi:hypothetical protein OG698_29700 [Streptomyces sp. NBC_01003]|uniref:hypothetical protein n=1 Tax=Streptomyces sp. NBC_01003 TaxID=2903714 RepID=UPI00386A4ECA|nr:hypothetical protein OG698_29700 [Streptomyces sp. NBC_01003]
MIIDAVVPGTLEISPDQRRRKVLWTLLTLLLLALAAWAFSYGLDYISAEQTTRHAKEAEDSVDREGSAFTSSIREDKDAIPSAYILDQPLTLAEKKKFLLKGNSGSLDSKDLEKIVASHKGRGLEMPGLPESDGYTTTWLMDFFSDRTAGLAITALRAKELKCSPAAAKTVILVRLEGGGAYDGMHFNLSRPETPIALAPGPYMGKPYFSHKKIDLGNGATPGGLYAEVSSGIEDCRFAFEAEYRDAEGVYRQEIRNGKSEFEVRGIPANPEQIFVVTLESATDCGGRPWRKIAECPPLPFQKGRYTIY